MPDTLTITDNRTGRTYEIPIQDGTIRADQLRGIKVDADDFGLMTYDPALMNTAACKSRITYIDGDKGILRYRGYPIDQLAEESSFLETAYLVLDGELPTVVRSSPASRTRSSRSARRRPASRSSYKGFPHDPYPMGVLAASFASLSTFYPESRRIFDDWNRKLQMHRVLGHGADARRLHLPPPPRPADRQAVDRPRLRAATSWRCCSGAGHAVQAAPGAGARARHPVHPARRPRAELQHDRDARRSAARRPTSSRRWPARSAALYGPAARRRQRGRPADARRDRVTSTTCRSSSSA